MRAACVPPWRLVGRGREKAVPPASPRVRLAGNRGRVRRRGPRRASVTSRSRLSRAPDGVRTRLKRSCEGEEHKEEMRGRRMGSSFVWVAVDASCSTAITRALKAVEEPDCIEGEPPRCVPLNFRLPRRLRSGVKATRYCTAVLLQDSIPTTRGGRDEPLRPSQLQHSVQASFNLLNTIRSALRTACETGPTTYCLRNPSHVNLPQSQSRGSAWHSKQ